MKMLIVLSLLFASSLTFAKDDQAKKAEAIAKSQLEKFDALDFDHYSNQKWDLLKLSHGKDIRVHWPDGHVTTGLEKHIEDLKVMFVFMPDLQISEHPIRIVGTNAGPSTRTEYPKKVGNLDLNKLEWTSVMGVMTGTFSKPMPLGNGKTMPPTGKTLKMNMVTVGHWTKDGVMDEEYLFWDNDTFNKQLGLK